jgi:hypothetical protein
MVILSQVASIVRGHFRSDIESLGGEIVFASGAAEANALGLEA